MKIRIAKDKRSYRIGDVHLARFTAQTKRPPGNAGSLFFKGE
jgi:hypothetical protein